MVFGKVFEPPLYGKLCSLPDACFRFDVGEMFRSDLNSNLMRNWNELLFAIPFLSQSVLTINST